jgi:hypothetical protein
MMKKTTIIAAMFAGAAPAVLANNADKFAQNDPIGWMMAVISMSVVFSALVILFLCFKYIYPLFAMLGLKIKKSAHRKKQYEQITDRRAQMQRNMKVVEKSSGMVIDDEELAAAIGVALFLHEDGMHDQESNILTLTPSNSAWTGAGNNQKRSPIRRF